MVTTITSTIASQCTTWQPTAKEAAAKKKAQEGRKRAEEEKKKAEAAAEAERQRAAASTAAAAPASLEYLSPEEREKRIKAIKKKLKQISEIKLKGGALQPDQVTKLAAEASLLADLAVLEGSP